SVECPRVARVAVLNLRPLHLANQRVASAAARKSLIVRHDDFSVAAHVDIQFQVDGAGPDRPLKGNHGVFRKFPGGTAMSKNPRPGRGKEIGIEYAAHADGSVPGADKGGRLERFSSRYMAPWSVPEAAGVTSPGARVAAA